MHCVVSWPRTSERVEIDHPNNAMMPNYALQRTRPSRSGCNPRVPWGRVAELESLGGRGDSWFFVHLNQLTQQPRSKS